MTQQEFENVKKGVVRSPYGRKCVICGKELQAHDSPGAWGLLKTNGKYGNNMLAHYSCMSVKGVPR